MTSTSNKIPEDLGLKIGTPDEVAWTAIKDKVMSEIEQDKRAIIINEEILKLAEKKILEEQTHKAEAPK